MALNVTQNTQNGHSVTKDDRVISETFINVDAETHEESEEKQREHDEQTDSGSLDSQNSTQIKAEAQVRMQMNRSRMGKSFSMSQPTAPQSTLDDNEHADRAVEEDNKSHTDNNTDKDENDSPRFSAFSSSLPPIPIMESGVSGESVEPPSSSVAGEDSAENQKIQTPPQLSLRGKENYSGSSVANGNEQINSGDRKREREDSEELDANNPRKKPRAKREAVFIRQPSSRPVNQEDDDEDEEDEDESDFLHRQETVDVLDFAPYESNALSATMNVGVSSDGFQSSKQGEDENDEDFDPEEAEKEEERDDAGETGADQKNLMRVNSMLPMRHDSFIEMGSSSAQDVSQSRQDISHFGMLSHLPVNSPTGLLSKAPTGSPTTESNMFISTPTMLYSRIDEESSVTNMGFPTPRD